MKEYSGPWRDDESLARWKLLAATTTIALLAVLLVWWWTSDDGLTETRSSEVASSTVTSIAESGPTSTEVGSGDDPQRAASSTSLDAVPGTSNSGTSSSVTSIPRTTLPSDRTSSTTIASTSSTNATSSTSTVATSSPASSTSPAAGYPTSPDGTPLPLFAVFDTTTITITGVVPSQAAKDRLIALAVANSQFPDVEVIDNMSINPAMPISVGVRVLELNSARFPEGTAEIKPDHAAELDRVVAIMNALPNISVLVIGHADQRGDDLRNIVRSDERARAVVNYLIFQGIAPARLSSRAAGATDLLTTENDLVAFALNRRTEFVFYGLLIE